MTSHPATSHPALAGVVAEPGATKPEPILVVDGVRKDFGGTRAVDVAHLEVQRGVVTGLIGPNGAGKTTLFNVLTGFDRADAGRWTFDGRDAAALPAHRLARRGMVRTFQLTRVLPRLTVLENAQLAAVAQRGERLVPALLRPLWRAQETEVRDGPTSCCCASSWPTSATTTPATCPGASASSWRWRGRSWSTRRSFCWTSRSPG